MSPHDGAVDHRAFIVRILGKLPKNTLPDASFSPSAEAAVDVFPVAEAFRQVPPWHARPVTIQDRLDKQPIVGRGDTDGAWLARQIVLDPIPLVIAEGVSVSS
jgi:hypothetical protein